MSLPTRDEQMEQSGAQAFLVRFIQLERRAVEGLSNGGEIDCLDDDGKGVAGHVSTGSTKVRSRA